MLFTAEKDTGIIPHVLTRILDNCVNGVTLSDPDTPDNPIVFANSVFERMTGYSREEILGHNCRFLQGDDRDQPALDEIRAAVREHRPIEVTLRNYRKDGTLFHNRLSIRPLHGSRSMPPPIPQKSVPFQPSPLFSLSRPVGKPMACRALRMTASGVERGQRQLNSPGGRVRHPDDPQRPVWRLGLRLRWSRIWLRPRPLRPWLRPWFR